MIISGAFLKILRNLLDLSIVVGVGAGGQKFLESMFDTDLW